MTLLAKINETAAFLKGKGMEAPEFGLILGSGLGELDEEIENPVVVDYSEIPKLVVQRLSAMPVNWSTVILLDVRFWPFKDVSTSTKETH